VHLPPKRPLSGALPGPAFARAGQAGTSEKIVRTAAYDQFEFEIPTAANGDCYDRAWVHVEEIRQSMRIVEQCVRNMPQGPYKIKPSARLTSRKGTNVA